MDISVVIPLLNEDESLPELAAWIEKVMQAGNFSWEVIFVDDGSHDNSWKIIENLSVRNPNFRGIKFRRNYGKSAALNVAFREVSGDVVITMDADLQDSPDEIPELYRMITQDGFDLVSGWKKKRHDPVSKTIPTKFYNWTARRMSGIDFMTSIVGLKHTVMKLSGVLKFTGICTVISPFLPNGRVLNVSGRKRCITRNGNTAKQNSGLTAFIKVILTC